MDNRERSDTTTHAERAGSARSESSAPLGLVQIHPVQRSTIPSVWTLRKQLLLGRGSDCGIRVDDASVSRQHAHFVVRGGRVSVADAGSRFGTLVDGRPIGSAPTDVPPGTILRIGTVLLLLVQDPERYAAPPHRIAADFIGTTFDALAGPETWRSWQAAIAAAPLSHPVLILGESGTGKEVIARLLHASRPTPSRLVSVNLGAIPGSLFEAELFGHSRGAFTGATKSRLGAFREASGGTLFLDEIGDLRQELQAKLLRVLETNAVRPLGVDGDSAIDTRVVAATSLNLDEAVESGAFRPDLFYRLAGVVIRLCPLRERRDEILMFVREQLGRESPELSISVEAAESLVLQSWPGNLRELHYSLVQGLLRMKLAGGMKLMREHLPDATPGSTLRRTCVPGEINLSLERLRRAMARSGGNATKAAALLGVSRATVYNFCARHHVDLAELREEMG